MAAVAPERAEVAQALAEIDAALDDTRAQRVAALAREPIAPAHLVSVLGDPPAHPAGRQVWCGLAYGIESYRDRHPEALGHEAHGGAMAAIGPRPGQRWDLAPEWDDMAERITDGPALVGIAADIGLRGDTVHQAEVSTWLSAVDAAGEALEAQGPRVEHGLTPDHGFSLGC